MKRTLFVVLITFSAIGMFLSGCGTKQSQKKIIGISLLTRGHMFYRDLEEGMREEAAQHGFELMITAGEWDLGKQVAQVEDFIARKVNAIVVCPVDSRGIGVAIKAANAAGIPVFTADIAAQE